MKTCPSCGKELTEQDRFCGGCGKEVSDSAETINLWDEVNAPKVPPSPAAVSQMPMAPAYATQPDTTISDGAAVKKPLPKWLLPTLIAVGTAIVVLIVCLLIFFKSDEQKIRERFDTFATAINTNDLEGVIACFDSNTRDFMEVALDVARINGNYKGIFGDLYETDGFTQMQVISVQIDGEKASATVLTTINGDSDSAVIPMVKENGEWYIDLMSFVTQSFNDSFSSTPPQTQSTVPFRPELLY